MMTSGPDRTARKWSEEGSTAEPLAPSSEEHHNAVFSPRRTPSPMAPGPAGTILARLSPRTMLFKQWKLCYYAIVGRSTLRVYRSQKDCAEYTRYEAQRTEAAASLRAARKLEREGGGSREDQMRAFALVSRLQGVVSDFEAAADDMRAVHVKGEIALNGSNLEATPITSKAYRGMDLWKFGLKRVHRASRAADRFPSPLARRFGGDSRTTVAWFGLNIRAEAEQLWAACVAGGAAAGHAPSSEMESRL